MTNYTLKKGILSVGEYKPAPSNEHFSGKTLLDLRETSGMMHYGAIALITDSLAQAQAICNILNKYRNEWQ